MANGLSIQYFLAEKSVRSGILFGRKYNKVRTTAVKDTEKPKIK